MTYTEAKRQLWKHGTAHATGDSLRAMYAKMIPWHCCLNPTAEKRFYAHLQKFLSDDAISHEARRILRNPLSAFEAAWPEPIGKK